MLTTRQLDWLLEDLCAMGFCLPPEAQRRLHEKQPEDVTSFVDFVFEAEGLDPTLSRRPRDLQQGVHDVIAAAFVRAGIKVDDA